jgi:hypothetical protein
MEYIDKRNGTAENDYEILEMRAWAGLSFRYIH